MKVTVTKKHHLVTEKYGHLDIEATVEIDSEEDNIYGDIESYAVASLNSVINPTLDHLNRSLDRPEGEEFIRAYVNSREVQ